MLKAKLAAETRTGACSVSRREVVRNVRSGAVRAGLERSCGGKRGEVNKLHAVWRVTMRSVYGVEESRALMRDSMDVIVLCGG